MNADEWRGLKGHLVVMNAGEPRTDAEAWAKYFREREKRGGGIAAPIPGAPDHRVSRLLSNANHKQGKDKRYYVGGLTLTPRKTAGGRVNMCPHASAGCGKACFAEFDRLAWRSSKEAAIARTLLLERSPGVFYSHLAEEIQRDRLKAARMGLPYALRLNVVSDYPFERAAPWLFAGANRGVQFYDYTKTLDRVLDPSRPPNYHLTYSRSEVNERECREALRAGCNVAVVFRDRPFPPTYWGRPVIDGDANDLRFLDPRETPGVIIGVRAKGKGAWTDETGFVEEKTVANTSEVTDWWEMDEASAGEDAL